MHDKEIANMVIGRVLLILRENNGYTQDDIAKHIVTVRQRVSLIEKGSSELTVPELLLLLELYQDINLVGFLNTLISAYILSVKSTNDSLQNLRSMVESLYTH